MSRNGQRLNEPTRDYSDEPTFRNPTSFDVSAGHVSVRLRAPFQDRPTSDRERVEKLRADPVARFDDVATARKLPRGVVP